MYLKTEKSKVYDIMKVITILLVAIGHTTRMYTDFRSIQYKSYTINFRYFYSINNYIYICN